MPVQSEADFTGRQYYQTPNQIACDMGWHNFSTKHGETESLFGLETGYGCCTANYHQGWPKFAANLWLATPDNGLAVLLYAPSKVNAKVADGIAVTFTEKTDYPFDEAISFTMEKGKTCFFQLYLHIPGWCESASITINGTEYQKPLAGSIAKIYRSRQQGDVVTLQVAQVLAEEGLVSGAGAKRKRAKKKKKARKKKKKSSRAKKKTRRSGVRRKNQGEDDTGEG